MPTNIIEYLHMPVIIRHTARRSSDRPAYSAYEYLYSFTCMNKNFMLSKESCPKSFVSSGLLPETASSVPGTSWYRGEYRRPPECPAPSHRHPASGKCNAARPDDETRTWQGACCRFHSALSGPTYSDCLGGLLILTSAPPPGNSHVLAL